MADDRDPFGFAPLWQELLAIYREFAEVCDRHGLRYYIAYGTALGAARHHGFIPWDDDFDVQMPREDYDRFLRVAGELPSPYKTVNLHNEPRFRNIFTKIMLADAKRVQAVEAATGVEQRQGIFIDIFPLDGFKSGRIAYCCWWCRYLFYRIHDWYLSRFLLSGKLRFLKRTVGTLFHWLSPWIDSGHKIAVALDRLARETPYADAAQVGYVVNPTFYRQRKHSPAEFAVAQDVKFMDVTVKTPADLHRYLCVEYGDYMRIPSASRQMPHHSNQPPAPWRFGAVLPKVLFISHLLTGL